MGPCCLGWQHLKPFILFGFIQRARVNEVADTIPMGRFQLARFKEEWLLYIQTKNCSHADFWRVSIQFAVSQVSYESVEQNYCAGLG